MTAHAGHRCACVYGSVVCRRANMACMWEACGQQGCRWPTASSLGTAAPKAV